MNSLGHASSSVCVCVFSVISFPVFSVSVRLSVRLCLSLSLSLSLSLCLSADSLLVALIIKVRFCGCLIVQNFVLQMQLE